MCIIVFFPRSITLVDVYVIRFQAICIRMLMKRLHQAHDAHDERSASVLHGRTATTNAASDNLPSAFSSSRTFSFNLYLAAV